MSRSRCAALSKPRDHTRASSHHRGRGAAVARTSGAGEADRTQIDIDGTQRRALQCDGPGTLILEQRRRVHQGTVVPGHSRSPVTSQAIDPSGDPRRGTDCVGGHADVAVCRFRCGGFEEGTVGRLDRFGRCERQLIATVCVFSTGQQPVSGSAPSRIGDVGDGRLAVIRGPDFLGASGPVDFRRSVLPGAAFLDLEDDDAKA